MNKSIDRSIDRFVKCSCSMHAVHVMKYPEDEEVYLSIWQHGTRSTPTLVERLRLCWKILRDGTPYGDEVVLTKNTAKGLADIINTMNS